MATLLFLLASTLLLITPFWMIYKPPNLLIRYFQYRWPDVLFHVTTTSKLIALTLDDAPSPYTPEILEILKANDATATFFVIGSQVEGREKMLQDLVRNGNELGNHAMRDEPSRVFRDDVLTQQIASVTEQIHATYAAANAEVPPRYFRPGSGFFSDRMRAVMGQVDHRLVLGSIYPHDAQIPYWRLNARHVLSMLRPGAIVICHDRRSWTLPMLRRVLPEMRRRGYRIVTVTELLKEAR